MIKDKPRKKSEHLSLCSKNNSEKKKKLVSLYPFWWVLLGCLSWIDREIMTAAFFSLWLWQRTEFSLQISENSQCSKVNYPKSSGAQELLTFLEEKEKESILRLGTRLQWLVLQWCKQVDVESHNRATSWWSDQLEEVGGETWLCHKPSSSSGSRRRLLRSLWMANRQSLTGSLAVVRLSQALEHFLAFCL